MSRQKGAQDIVFDNSCEDSGLLKLALSKVFEGVWGNFVHKVPPVYAE